MGYAAALGVFGGFAGLLFLGLIGDGEKWNVDSSPHWLGGHWWWVAVTAAAGLVVGVLHRWLHVPEETPGIIAEAKTGQVDARLVPATVLISAVSLMGGASLGPEKALGSMGGGVATWIARRRALGNEDSQVNVLSGMAGAYGGMLSSPVITVMLLMEVARPGGNRFTKTLLGTIIASSVPASASVSTSPSRDRCFSASTRCRSTNSKTGSSRPGFSWAGSRPSW